MKRVLIILTVVCFFTMLTIAVAYASPMDNQQLITEYEKNKAIVEQQLLEEDQRILELILRGAKDAPDSREISDELLWKQGLDPIEPAYVKGWLGWNYRDQGKGGSGLGESDSYWTALDELKNHSRAWLGGNRWARTYGWDYYTPSVTGWYDVTTTFYATGQIVGDATMQVRVRVTDTTNNTTVTRTIWDPRPATFDNLRVQQTEPFYLRAGRQYSFMFETESTAYALISAATSDFGWQGGNKIEFWSMVLTD